MGRKNRRLSSTQDKNFEKFIRDFSNEKKTKETHLKKPVDFRKDNHNRIRVSNAITPKPFTPAKEKENIDYEARNKERLEYAKQRFDILKIKYEVVDSKTTLLNCYRKSDDKMIKFYASSGCIIGYPEKRGLKALINILIGKE